MAAQWVILKQKSLDVYFLIRIYMTYRLLGIVIKMSQTSRRKPWFRFQSYWILTNEFKSSLRQNWENDIRKSFVEYFKNLLNGDFDGLLVDEGLFLEGRKVSERECIDLVRTCSDNEVAQVVKNLSNGEAARPDGFNSEFYKASWPMCGKDIFESIKTFFRDEKMPSGISSTYLALISKVKGAMNPKDFRPISCCNVIYKIISTILTNRLRPILAGLISDSHAAFIQGRNLAHNVSLAQELLCQYNRVNASKRCMLKIDISKAYDMVD
ncbi:hypothetical protein QQ045_010460 [Rhodiola kirilowii]